MSGPGPGSDGPGGPDGPGSEGPGSDPLALTGGPFPGLDTLLGLVVDEITPDRVTAHLDLGPQHHQPFGIVHGGVYCAVVETVGSIGASQSVGEGQAVVGVNNNTHFLASASEGRVVAVGTPISRGRTQQLWQIDVTREHDGRLLATGQLRLQAITPRS